MISIIRIQSQGEPGALWNAVLRNADRLQAALGEQGRILYLSKRRGHPETSLFVHVRDADILGDFISGHLSRLKSVTGLWMFAMLNPRFLPLPPETRSLKRYAVSVKADPARVKEVYDGILGLPLPKDIRLLYLTYTFHLLGDSLQLSVLSGLETGPLQSRLGALLDGIPGLLHKTVCEIEKTYPFISQEEWRDYARRHSLPDIRDEQNMLAQFRR